MLKDVAGSGNLELDATLSIAGKAADAKAVGDAIGKISGGNVVQGGLSTTATHLLIEILRNGVYSTNQSANITALEASLKSGGTDEPDVPVVPDEPEVTLYSISAIYNGGDVIVGTALTDLTGIMVTAHYFDGTSNTVTGYTLSGEIAEGENTVTVSYGGKTTTFTVMGVAESGGKPVTMLSSMSPGDGNRFKWYTDDGTIPYTGSITTRSAIRAIASSAIFDTDTTVVVNISATTQAYDYFVAASTDWDGVTDLTLGDIACNNFNCVEAGAKTWDGDGLSHQITTTVKAGMRLAIYSFVSTFGDLVSVSVEVAESDEETGADIPADATRLAGITSNGTQYINTGVKITPYMGLKSVWDIPGNPGSDKVLYGAKVTNQNRTYFCIFNATILYAGFCSTSGGQWQITPSIYSQNDVTITTGKGMINEINGAGYKATYIEYAGTSQEQRNIPWGKEPAAEPVNLYLFAQNTSGTADSHISATLKEFIIYSDEELTTEVMHLVPVRDGDGVVCLYDTVGKQYLRNGGIGEFAALEVA